MRDKLVYMRKQEKVERWRITIVIVIGTITELRAVRWQEETKLLRERCHDKNLEFNIFPILSSTQKHTTAPDAATRDIA